MIGEGNGTPLQYSCLENPMDGRAWWAAVHGVGRSRTQLSDFTLFFHFQALKKEMATHSSVLAWRIPGTGEPGGLLSMGSHRVGHKWSDLAAAYEVISHYGFDLPFVYLFWRHVCSDPFWFFNLFVFLFLSSESPLYTLDASPLLDIWFAIFSPIQWAVLPLSWLCSLQYKSVSFDKVQLVNFFFCFLYFCFYILKNHCQIQVTDLCPCFLLRVPYFQLLHLGLWCTFT